MAKEESIFTSYSTDHYSRYLGDCGIHRPSILDQFLSDSRTCRMVHDTKLHIAIIVKRGKILAEATNKVASRSNGAASRGSRNYIHAERNVLRTLGDTSKLRGADMYVMRFSRETEMRIMKSTPCPACMVFLDKCMKEYGLKNVYFTA